MKNGLFKLTWENIKSGAIYGILMLVSTIVLSIAQQVLEAKTFLGLNWLAIIDSSAVATLPLVIVVVSYVKNLLTTSDGKFLNATEVIPDKK